MMRKLRAKSLLHKAKIEDFNFGGLVANLTTSGKGHQTSRGRIYLKKMQLVGKRGDGGYCGVLFDSLTTVFKRGGKQGKY